MRFLGIDFGRKRIGIAISDEEGRIAFPRRIIKNDETSIGTILELLKEEKIDGMVIGESLDYKGVENKIEKDIISFIQEIKNKVKIPIHRQKEFFTTVEARKFQELSGKDGKIDDTAAALILQRYLDKINKENL